jgi:transposase-like protein
MLRNGFPNSCSGCGIGPEWNGKKLTLQLEHINGVYNDNRIENLTFLCPNCHSQTPTFSGKKSGSKRIHPICQICNLPKQNFYSGTHSACTPKRTKIDWPDNDELRKMVSENGYSKTGRLLGVSDNAVRKHLKNN